MGWEICHADTRAGSILETVSREQGAVKSEKPHRNLVAWQRAMELITEVYQVTDRFPKEEIFGLTSQIRRAAVSVPSNTWPVK